jgi:hypothetical protein
MAHVVKERFGITRGIAAFASGFLRASASVGANMVYAVFCVNGFNHIFNRIEFLG